MHNIAQLPQTLNWKFVLLYSIWDLVSERMFTVNGYYLRTSGGVRISPSQSASNVKIRPRHITIKWEGQGPSRSVAKHKMYMTQN